MPPGAALELVSPADALGFGLPLGGALVLGVAMAVTTRPVLASLPEPTRDAAGKTPYHSLATPRFQLTVGVAGALAALIVALRVPAAHWLAWGALAVVNVLACAIDARTTWLPRRLSHAGWLVAALGVAVAALAERSWTPALAATIGAAAVGGFFHLAWRWTGQLGYGDVRLAATIGAVTALSSPLLVATALLAGTLLGAATGIGWRLTGRAGGFPYGPGLLAGAFASLVLPSG